LSHTRETLTVGDRGRLVLPARIRAALGIRMGDHLVLTGEPDGSLRLTPHQVLAQRDRGAFAPAAGPDSVVDELLAERRAEARREHG
jgi:AbrB family looped-hinge helix DNA binding protein